MLSRRAWAGFATSKPSGVRRKIELLDEPMLKYLCRYLLWRTLVAPPGTGARHGLQRGKNGRNATTWNFSNPLVERMHFTDAYERECIKLFFVHANTSGSRDAAVCAATMTPLRRTELRPTSVLEVVNALDGMCEAAPSYVILSLAAKDVPEPERDRLEGKHGQQSTEVCPGLGWVGVAGSPSSQLLSLCFCIAHRRLAEQACSARRKVTSTRRCQQRLAGHGALSSFLTRASGGRKSRSPRSAL